MAADAKTAQSTTGDAAKPYVVFARRFRPQTFADVAGQSAVTGALRQALMSGRLAQAYLLCGPRGVGKTSLARIFAKACNCLNGTGPNGAAEEPCNTCSACVSIQNGSSMDVIEMDAATNRGIEEVRSLRENVGIAPAELRYKVYIIDEVHMLTREAWNAFLKTLEEPPPHVKFIFATTDPNDVPETILSRCQRFDLRRISLSDIVKRLRKICEADNIVYEEAALSRIASLAKGGLRDAEGILDQAVNLGGGKVSDATIRELSGAAPDELIFEMLKGCAAGKTAEVLAKSHEALEAGADPDDMLAVLSERLRSTVLTKVCGPESPLLEGQTHLKDSYVALGSLLSEDQCLMLIQLFTNARRQMRDAAQTRLPFEVALIRASRAKELIDLGKLASALESNAGRTPQAQSGAPPNRPPTAPSGESPRPNLEGRLATDNTQPAAAPRPNVATNAAPDKWQRVIDAIKAQRGGAILASSLSHSSVAFDLERSEITLGTDSTFYRDALVNPQNQQALKQALTQIYGRTLTISVTGTANVPVQVRAPAQGIASTGSARASQTGQARSGSMSASPPIPLRAPTQAPRPAVRAEPEEAPWETIAEEPIDEYLESDALPLRASIPQAEAEAAPLQEDSDRDEAPPPAPAQRFDAPAIRKPRNDERAASGDTKLVEGNALVQAVLKGTGGIVLEVATSKKKSGEGK